MLPDVSADAAKTDSGEKPSPESLPIHKRPIMELLQLPPRPDIEESPADPTAKSLIETSQSPVAPADATPVTVFAKNAAHLPLSEETVRQREQMSAPEIVDRLRSALQRVDRTIVGREDVVVQTMYALLCREHQLLYSRAGLAKSLYASAVFAQFVDASTFKVQLTKGTTEESLVGAIDVEELKRGSIIHNTDGSIVDADLAFLDELFDANDPSLRSMLGILNERKFQKGKQQVSAELHTAIATTNYLRANDVTEAVIDRFLFRAVLLPDRDPLTMLQIDQSYESGPDELLRPKPGRALSITEIDYLADIVENKVPEHRISAEPAILFLKNVIINRFVDAINEERAKTDKALLYISPRTIAKARDILNAAALIRGREEITASDLTDMKYMICTIGDAEKQEETFDRVAAATIKEFSSADLKAINFLMKGHNLAMQLITKAEAGETIPPTFYQKVLMFFNLESMGNLTFAELLRVMKKVAVENPEVGKLKAKVIQRIAREMNKLDGKDPSPLFC